MIQLRPVTQENVRAVCDLVLAPSQERFVAPAAVSMAQAGMHPEAAPRALYAGDELVGMLMLELRPGAQDAGLWRLMVDARHQGRGYGAAAVRAVVEEVRGRGYRRLLLSHVPGEGNPGPFYEKLGFRYTGSEDEGELVMGLDLAPGASDLAFAHRLADAAGAAILPHFRTGLGLDDKASRPFDVDPVTLADRAAEQAARALLDVERPEDAVLGEEFGRRAGSSGREWVLDPIDGTRGFVTGFPTWGTLVGLRDAEGPRVGVINQPYTGERWWGDGEQAWHRDRAGERRLHVRACASLADAVYSTTSPETFRSPYERRVLEAFQGRTRLRRYGGDCYAYALLAAGQLDVIAESGLQVYDWVALLPVLRGAGALFSAWDGGPPGHDGTLLAAGDARVFAEARALLDSCR